MTERQQSVRGARTLPARAHAPSRPAARPQEVRQGSLRSKIVVALGAVLIPAALIACIWTMVQDRRLHEIKVGQATRATQRVAQDINVFLRDALLVAATQFSPDEPTVTDPERCRERMNDIVRERRDYGFTALLVDGDVVCFHDTGAYLPIDGNAAATIGSIRDAMANQLSRAINPAFVRSPDGRYLLLGVNVPPAHTAEAANEARDVLAIFSLRLDVLNYMIATTRLGIDRGTAVMTREGEVVVQSSSIPGGGDWLPRDRTVLRDALAAPQPHEPILTRAGSDAPSSYFTAATLNPDLLVLTGYPDTLLFATERSILLGSLLPPLIMLIAAAAGTLWAVERLVVRWITYLQRVTRVYGSGRLSARAVHIGDAPREIAELGVSFNQMADNIANQALQRERTVKENETLLRELHHRVKNNFQVIVSLLSLQKQSVQSGGDALSAADVEGLRFIEDHVQAMSVAYRVGYSSGDLGEASPAELLHDVIDSLRRSAGLTQDDIVEEPPPAGHAVDLDRALGITLYLAATLPAYLDAVARIPPGEERPKVHIDAAIIGSGSAGETGPKTDTLRLSFALAPPLRVTPTPLQERLARAYIRQLDATPVPGDVEGQRVILVPLESVRRA